MPVNHGDEFQERIWDLVRQNPYGETVTDGELARNLGDGTTAQEVGAAVGRNPVCILILPPGRRGGRQADRLCGRPGA